MLAVCLASSSVSKGQQAAESEWTGFVRDNANNAAGGAVIDLRGRAAHFSQTAGENGAFHFAHLTPGTYQLTVSYKSTVFHFGKAVSLPSIGIAQLTLTSQASI